MATNDFLSQLKFKRLSQSIWLNLIHVLLLLIVIVGLGFFFFFFFLQNFNLFIFNTAHPAPPFFLGLHARGCCSTVRVLGGQQIFLLKLENQNRESSIHSFFLFNIESRKMRKQLLFRFLIFFQETKNKNST